MGKFIPYEKLSKKAKRELDLKKRGTWGGLNPVTRVPPNPKAYNRRKAQKWSDGSGSAPCVLTARIPRPRFSLPPLLTSFTGSFII